MHNGGRHGTEASQLIRAIYIIIILLSDTYTVEPLNNGHGGDEHFVHCSEVVPSSEVLPLSTITNISLLNHMNNDITDQG